MYSLLGTNIIPRLEEIYVLLREKPLPIMLEMGFFFFFYAIREWGKGDNVGDGLTRNMFWFKK